MWKSRLADDPTGDHLDALLCAIQAAWAWTKKDNGYGAPNPVDPLEGWIADPAAAHDPQPTGWDSGKASKVLPEPKTGPRKVPTHQKKMSRPN